MHSYWQLVFPEAQTLPALVRTLVESLELADDSIGHRLHLSDGTLEDDGEHERQGRLEDVLASREVSKGALLENELFVLVGDVGELLLHEGQEPSAQVNLQLQVLLLGYTGALR